MSFISAKIPALSIAEVCEKSILQKKFQCETITIMYKLSVFLISIFFSISAWAKYNYTLQWDKPNTHTYRITMETEPQTLEYTDIQSALWRPGRYITQDFAAAIWDVSAKDGAGNVLKIQKISKNTWRVFHGKTDKIVAKYAYYAENDDAGSSYYVEGQVYFNPSNCFMYVPNRWDDAVNLTIPDLPSSWKVATALIPTKDPHLFTANSYHDFADSPTVFAEKMKILSFTAKGTVFYLYFQGEYRGNVGVDSALVKQIRKIVLQQAAVFGGFPFKTYHFIYRLLDYDMRHAVEHNNSASFVLPAKVTETEKSVVSGVCGITSHEFWHAWNVKRIRPAALVPYNYGTEQYTGLHWFTEGVTDYYSTLTMIRAGVISREEGLKTFASGFQSLDNTYAYSVVSPEESSFNSWLAHSSYAHPLHGTSYYPSGQRLGVLIDLKMLAMTKGKKSLDDVFRYLYKEYAEKGLGVPEDGIQKAIELISGASWQDFFDAYIHHTTPIDYQKIMEGTGVSLSIKENNNLTWEKLGIVQYEKLTQGWFIKKINPAGDAYKAGIAGGDLIFKVNGKMPQDVNENEVFKALQKGKDITLDFINQQGYEHRETLKYTGSAIPVIYSFSINEDNALIEQWLGEK